MRLVLAIAIALAIYVALVTLLIATARPRDSGKPHRILSEPTVQLSRT